MTVGGNGYRKKIHNECTKWPEEGDLGEEVLTLLDIYFESSHSKCD